MTTKSSYARKKDTVKIDRGLPVPTTREWRNAKYPFRQMKVGDSFFYETTSDSRLRSASSWFGTRNNMKFSTRKVDGGYRVWRIK